MRYPTKLLQWSDDAWSSQPPKHTRGGWCIIIGTNCSKYMHKYSVYKQQLYVRMKKSSARRACKLNVYLLVQQLPKDWRCWSTLAYSFHDANIGGKQICLGAEFGSNIVEAMRHHKAFRKWQHQIEHLTPSTVTARPQCFHHGAPTHGIHTQSPDKCFAQVGKNHEITEDPCQASPIYVLELLLDLWHSLFSIPFD